MSAWALRYSRRDPSFITQPMMRTVHLRQFVSGPLNFKTPADNPSLLGQRQEIHLPPTTGTLLRSPHNRNQSDNRSMDANYKLAPILTLALPILRSASRKDTQLSRPLQHNHLLPTSIINNLPTNHTLPSRPNPPHNLPIPITIPNHHDHPNHAPQTSLPNRQNQMGLHPLRSPFRHLHPHNLGPSVREPRLRLTIPDSSVIRAEYWLCDCTSAAGVLEYSYLFLDELGDLWGLVEGVEREARIEEDEDAN